MQSSRAIQLIKLQLIAASWKSATFDRLCAHWKGVFKSALLQLKGRVALINSLDHRPEADKASSQDFSPLGLGSSLLSHIFPLLKESRVTKGYTNFYFI